MLTFAQAREQLLSSICSSLPQERVFLGLALGRVLAEDVYAVSDAPPQCNSAMDGFAVCCADVIVGQPLKISQKIFAGSTPLAVQPSTAVRLFTGSVIPEGADAVVLQEDCSYTDSDVQVMEMPLVGQHIRWQGEDIRCGVLLLAKGVKLQPRHIAYLIAGGIADVSVYKTLKVGLLATGDELCAPGTVLSVGQIYNSNLYMLQAELQHLGFTVQARQVGDDVKLINAAFVELCHSNDVVLSIGGVSVGEADFVKQAISGLGELLMWKVAMKPGKPLSYGIIAGTPVMGLPGNPVSAFATFHLFAKPYLIKMQGELLPDTSDKMWPVLLHSAMNPHREEFLRVQLQMVEGEEWLVPYAKQGSAVLSSIVWADGFARIPSNCLTQSGDQVQFIRFD